MLIIAMTLSQTVMTGARALISYRVLALGGDAIAVGVIAAMFAVVPLFIAVSIGRAVDRGRGLLALRLGLLVGAVSVVAAAWSDSLVALALASAMLGCGQILTTIACQGLIPLWSEPGQLDRRFSRLTLGASLGQLAGFPVAGFIASLGTPVGASEVVTTPALLVLGLIAAAAVPLSFAFTPADRTRRTRKEQAIGRQSSLQILGSVGMKPATYASLTMLSSMDLLTAYLPVFGQAEGLGVGTVTALLTARSFASVLSRFFLPALLATVPRRVLLVSATLGPALPLFLMPLTPQIIPLTAAMLAVGFFFGIGQPLTLTWVTQVADFDNRATAISVRMAGNRLGQIAIPLAAGSIAGLAGIGSIFYLGGALLFSAGISTIWSTRR